jgi:hypothetical protein
LCRWFDSALGHQSFQVVIYSSAPSHFLQKKRIFYKNRIRRDIERVMGQQRERLRRFLAKHPNCCFCGGNNPATTKDHIPPRSVFSNHKWPESYEFPACLNCNNGSARDDAVIALYSRFNPGQDRTEEGRAEWLRHLRAFNENYPGEAQKSLLTANEKRRYLGTHKIAKPDGVAYGELPLIKFTPFVREVIDRFSRKMTLAFHYKHTNKIVPADAWVMTQFWTNLHRMVNAIPQEIFDLVPSGVELRRDNRSLSDQFSYRFGISDDGTMGVYMAAFRKTFIVAGLICFDASLMKDVGDNDIDRAMNAVSGDQGSSPSL